MSPSEAQRRGFDYEEIGSDIRDDLRIIVNKRYDLEGHHLTAESYSQLCAHAAGEMLKAPATARFGSDVDVEVDGYGIFEYVTHVDAQNGFGALIRSRVGSVGFVDDNVLHLWVSISD